MRSRRYFGGPDGPPSCPQTEIPEGHLRCGPDRLEIIGLGPGSPQGLTFEAREALNRTEAAVGYGLYIDQARPHLNPDCRIIASGMTREMDRAQKAIDLAREGLNTAVISGGDSGVYAMAGAVFELAAAQKLPLGQKPGELYIKVIAGIPAVISGAALLGAPLTHDFCAISLSDRLTPWEVIEKRLSLAGQGGFVIALYNPKSHGRSWQLAKAAEILSRHLPPKTPVGLAGRVGREGEKTQVTTLDKLAEKDVDMQTLVIVGSPSTFVYRNYLITPRGYMDKYWSGE